MFWRYDSCFSRDARPTATQIDSQQDLLYLFVCLRKTAKPAKTELFVVRLQTKTVFLIHVLIHGENKSALRGRLSANLIISKAFLGKFYDDT